MNTIRLPQVTLLGVDCVDVSRLQKALDISSQHIEFATSKLLTHLPTNDPRRVVIPPITSIEQYSEFCIRELYKYVDTPYVLLVQHDGFVLNPDSWTDEFLQYDYIGATWQWDVADWSIGIHFYPDEYGNRIVGNGGFSLRSRKFLETTARLADLGIFETYDPEDVVLCVWHRMELEAAGMKFAPAEVGMKFSIEGKRDTYSNQFGFHDLRITDISKWIHENPHWNIQQNLQATEHN